MSVGVADGVRVPVGVKVAVKVGVGDRVAVRVMVNVLVKVTVKVAVRVTVDVEVGRLPGKVGTAISLLHPAIRAAESNVITVNRLFIFFIFASPKLFWEFAIAYVLRRIVRARNMPRSLKGPGALDP